MGNHEDPNQLFKSLAKLRSIKSNIDVGRHEIQEKYVHEYNETAKSISAVLSDDLSSFIVESEHIKPMMGSYNSLTREASYSSDKWCETQLVLTKLDGLLNYLEMLLSNQEPKPPIGFRSS